MSSNSSGHHFSTFGRTFPHLCASVLHSAQTHTFDCLLESSTTHLTLCPNSGLFCSFRRFLISLSDDAHFLNDAHNAATVSRNTHLIELVLTWINHVICIPERLKRAVSPANIHFLLYNSPYIYDELLFHCRHLT